MLKALDNPQARWRSTALWAIPPFFAVLGLLIRYLAYSGQVHSPSLNQFPHELCRWDCGWYVRLAENGYDRFPVAALEPSANWAFFPLYPVLVGLLRTVTGLSTVPLAAGLSILLSMVAVRAAWPLLGRDLRTYILLGAFILAGPFSIYFTTFYTETLFFLLSVLALLALERRARLLTGLVVMLLSATRIVGVFFVLALVLRAWLDHRSAGGTMIGFVPSVLRRPDLLLAIFIAPLGLFIYMAFFYWQVGDALAFSDVQRAWGRVTDNPFVHLWAALTNIPTEGFGLRGTQLLGLSAILATAMAGVMVARRQYPAGLWTLICIYGPMTAGTVSLLRFTVGMAPVVVTAMTLLAPWRVIRPFTLSDTADLLSNHRWLAERLAYPCLKQLCDPVSLPSRRTASSVSLLSLNSPSSG